MATPGKIIAAGAAGGDPTLICSKKSRLVMLVLSNNSNAVRRVKVYDKATAPASTDTPVLCFEVAATSVLPVPLTQDGISCALGIGIRIVTGQADNDNTAATAADVVVNYLYELG